eukprot:2303301-Amphidinium_carterae.1
MCGGVGCAGGMGKLSRSREFAEQVTPLFARHNDAGEISKPLCPEGPKSMDCHRGSDHVVVHDQQPSEEVQALRAQQHI